MNRAIIFFLIVSVVFGFGATAQAEEWIDVGPAIMPLSDFQDLQKMVGGQKGAGDRNSATVPQHMVDAGMARLSQSDYNILVNLISGQRRNETQTFMHKEEVIDLGTVLLLESDLTLLQKMVSDGIFPSYIARLKHSVFIKAPLQ